MGRPEWVEALTRFYSIVIRQTELDQLSVLDSQLAHVLTLAVQSERAEVWAGLNNLGDVVANWFSLRAHYHE